MFKLLLVVEFREAENAEEAQEALDHFRESVLPSLEYGITLMTVPGVEVGDRDVDDLAETFRQMEKFSPPGR